MRIRKILCFIALVVLSFNVKANDLIISGVTTPSTTTIQFTIQWNNSWYTAAPSNNYDAAWVFIKTQVCALGSSPWAHALVSTVSANHSITGGVMQVDAVTDGMGVFIHRTGIGSGNVGPYTVTITFQSAYVLASTNFEVLGIEMVYVPQGSFTVGDGSSLSTQSYGGWGTNNTTLPYTISSEAAIAFDGMRNDADDPANNNAHNSIPAAFPKGYNAYYCMKYEISTEQYATFLNLIDYNSQSNRTAVAPNSAVGTMAMTTAANPNRNYIEITTVGVPFSTPAVYGWDANQNGTFDEAADGAGVSCNYLNWGDVIAYLDWAALRPMTEFEFEKVARGVGASPTTTEYPWGSTTINQAISSSLTNSGQNTEVSTSTLDGLCAYNGGASTSLGPLRVGFAATAISSRTNAGVSFYGAMDLGGNLWEQCMMAGYYTGATGRMASPVFTNQNGDGALDVNGNANQSTWVGGASVSIVRGGNWEYAAQRVQTSDRFYAGITTENATRTRRTGGRGVRCYP